MHILEEFVEPELRKAFDEYLGCQNVKLLVLSVPELLTDAPDDFVAQFADLQMGVFLDADAASGDGKGIVVGLCLISKSIEERKMVDALLQTLEEMDKEGVLRRKGKAVCFIGCKGVDGIWVYGEEGGKWRARILWSGKRTLI